MRAATKGPKAAAIPMVADSDVTATGAAVFDRVARLRCGADCNGDGRVTAADLPCTTRALAVS